MTRARGWSWVELSQRTAKLFRLFRPLVAYTLDIAGSCCGILAFMAASWLRSALRITRRSRRIYTLGWFSLYDDPPNIVLLYRDRMTASSAVARSSIRTIAA